MTHLFIIPAAGKGTRFQELGKNYPKCILPVQNKPILMHNIDGLSHAYPDSKFLIVASLEGYEVIKNMVDCYYEEELDVGLVEVISYDANNVINPGPVSTLHFAYEHIVAENTKYMKATIVLSDILLNTESFQDGELRFSNFLSVNHFSDTSRWCIAEPTEGCTKFHDKPKQHECKTGLTGLYHFEDTEKLLASIELNKNEAEISSILSTYEKLIENRFALIPVILEDYGTLKEYLNNRNIRNSRDFNHVEREDRLVHKSSSYNTEKIIAEMNWYRNLPPEIATYTPTIHKADVYSDTPKYSMAYIRYPTARELFLFLDGSQQTWTGLFDAVFDLSKKMSEYKTPATNTFLDRMWRKTLSRIDAINLPLPDGVDDFMQEWSDSISDVMCYQDSLFHGDLCFSNILYDPMSGDIKIIDPRGEAYGNIIYDMAKLMHSAVYRYDVIDSELYSNHNDEVYFYDANRKVVEELFMQRLENAFPPEAIRAIRYTTASLFLSMVPLHYHNEMNQRLFIKEYERVLQDARA